MLPAGQQVSEKGLSAMKPLKVWPNQQIAKILGDLKEREPVEDPIPTRACCRVFFMVSLFLGFSLLLVYNFIDAPDAQVVQIHRLTPGDKNDAFPSCFLYDRSSPSCKKWFKGKFPPRIPVSCPCTDSSAPWKNFVKFYILHENSTDRNMEFMAVSYPRVATQHNQELVTQNPLPVFYPKITLPDVDSIRLGNENVVKDTEVLTAENFCNLSYLWPIANSSISPGTVVYEVKKVADNQILREHCVWMATLLFPGPYEDLTRSIRSLNTPSLLNWEGLNTLFAQLARGLTIFAESVLTRRLALDMAVSLDAGNQDFRRFYNALAHLLTGLLDRNEMNPSPSQSYVYGAQDLSDTLSSNQFYDKNATVWNMGDESGPIFLQPEIDWEAYRQNCNPEYCEVIMPMQGVRKLYRALGILGGVATIVLAVVTTLLWPCTAMLLLWISERNVAAVVMLLLWISKRKTAQKGGLGVPQVALVVGPQPVELTSGS